MRLRRIGTIVVLDSKRIGFHQYYLFRPRTIFRTEEKAFRAYHRYVPVANHRTYRCTTVFVDRFFLHILNDVVEEGARKNYGRHSRNRTRLHFYRNSVTNSQSFLEYRN